MSNVYTFEIALVVNIDAHDESEALRELQEVIDEIDHSVVTPGFETRLCCVMADSGEILYINSADFVPFPYQF